MCGICGILSPDRGAAVDSALLRAMNDTMRLRGPDGEGFHVGPRIGLAMRRLSIIDVAGGAQPIANERGTLHVVQNGEIYNHAALRSRLQEAGHRFSTPGSDTEVLVHLYEEYGLAFLDHVRGMFAVALWDEEHERLVLARDPYGIKPLYYRVDGDGTLAFASDLRALCVGQGSSPEVDRHALAAYLAFNSVPSPLSIYAGIRKLPAGHVLISDERGLQISRYARPRPADREDLRREPLATLAPELLDRLRDSVRAHLVADVPVGVLLSGGVDSGALTALAAEASGARVRTFSVGFEDSSFDELAGARLVARRYDTDHREVVLRADAVAWLEAVAGAFDEPFADSSAVATYLVCGLASEHVKVVLSGEGADELFGGYYTYVADSLAPRIGRLAGAAAPVVRRLPSSSARASFDYRLKRFVQAAALPALERHHGWKEIFSEDARASLLVDAADLDDPVDLLRRRFAETEGAEALARLQDVDVGVYLADDLLVKTDRTSMAHSVEARVPFLDREVAALAYALPRSARVRGLDKKRLLRRAVAPLLPREVVHGRKRGFSIPAAGWLRGDLVPFAREVLSPAAVRRQGFFDPAAVNRLLERHIAGREDVSRQLWGLLSFALWYEQRDAARSGATGLPSSLVR